MATTHISTPKSRSYAVREAMGGANHDVHGAWVALVELDGADLPHVLAELGYEDGSPVILHTTSNAGFQGIVVSGTDEYGQRPFHGVSLGIFADPVEVES